MVSKIPKNEKPDDGPPYLFMLLQKCERYNIDYNLMCDLNYNDLKALIIEYDIQSVKEYFRSKQKALDNARGVEIVDATDEDVARLHQRK